MYTSGTQWRFALRLFRGFAFVALQLAAAGIYGALSGSVAERIREIGVRAALGASRERIVGSVVREGMTPAGLGGFAGAIGALAGAGAIARLRFAVSPLDPVTYGGVAVLLTVVSPVACGIPAWRAARVDPAITLRSE